MIIIIIIIVLIIIIVIIIIIIIIIIIKQRKTFTCMQGTKKFACQGYLNQHTRIEKWGLERPWHVILAIKQEKRLNIEFQDGGNAGI